MSEPLARAMSTSRGRRTVQMGVLAWLVTWVLVGVWAGWSLWDLGSLGDRVAVAGQSLTRLGQSVQRLDSVPVLGQLSSGVGNNIVTSGTQVVASGHAVHTDLHRLGLLLGLSIAVIPSASMLGIYLPARAALAKAESAQLATQ